MRIAILFTVFVSSVALFSAPAAFAEEAPVEMTEIPGAGSTPTGATEMPAADPAPSEMTPSEVTPPEMAPQAEVKPVRKVRRTARAGRDARHCLDLPTNSEIIKCAEKYL